MLKAVKPDIGNGEPGIVTVCFLGYANVHEFFLSENTHRRMKKIHGKAKRFLLSVKIL
jgi:hypothetical protein